MNVFIHHQYVNFRSCVFLFSDVPVSCHEAIEKYEDVMRCHNM